LDKKDSEFVLI